MALVNTLLGLEKFDTYQLLTCVYDVVKAEYLDLRKVSVPRDNIQRITLVNVNDENMNGLRFDSATCVILQTVSPQIIDYIQAAMHDCDLMYIDPNRIRIYMRCNSSLLHLFAATGYMYKYRMLST